MSNQKIVTETALSALASDIKTALLGKANSNDVYPKSQTYNRTEIDNALELKADKSELYNVYPTDKESGAIAHFTDGADNIPVKSLVSQIVAVQSGNGQPKSPTNPYTISGFANGIITRCGKNLGNFANQTISANIVQTIIIGTLFLKGGYSYTISCKQTPSVLVSQTRNTFFVKRPDGSNVYGNSNVTIPPLTFTAETDGIYTLYLWGHTLSAETTYSEIQLELGNQATTFESYNGNDYTFTFGQTVYGGHFDNKGNLVVTHKIIDLGDLSWTYHAPSGDVSAYFDTYLPSDSITGNRDIAFDGMSEIYNIIPSRNIGLSGSNIDVCALAHGTRRFITCDQRYTDATSYTNAVNGVMLVYPLATPITVSITSQDIPTLLGENNIFSNCGDVEVNYHADIGLYIDKKVSSLAQA